MKKANFNNIILLIPIAIAVGVFLFSTITYAEENSWYWYMNNGRPRNEMATPEGAQDKDSHLLSMSGRMSEQTQPQNDKEKPQYVLNEIIVKFKAEAALTLERQTTEKGKAPGEIKFTASAASLDKLNKKYKVKKVAPIFKDFKRQRKNIEYLKAKSDLKEHFKKKYAINAVRLSKKEEHILKRLKRGPKDAKIPDLDQIYKLELEEGQSVEEAVAEYKKDPNVEYAQPNYVYTLYATPLPPEDYIPDDYYIEDNANPGLWRESSWSNVFPDLWGHSVTQAIEAYNIFDFNHNGIIDGDEKHPGEDIVVAVIDQGLDFAHPDIQGNIWINSDEIPDNGIDDDGNGCIDDIRGYDFSDEDNDPSDYDGHGTHCAGTIAARGNNEIGIAGIAYAAKIMPVKMFPYATSAVAAQCIRYAAANGADVLSNSWGSSNRLPSDSTIQAAIDEACGRLHYRLCSRK